MTWQSDRAQLFTFSMLVLLRDTTRRKQGNGASGKDSPREHLLPSTGL